MFAKRNPTVVDPTHEEVGVPVDEDVVFPPPAPAPAAPPAPAPAVPPPPPAAPVRVVVPGVVPGLFPDPAPPSPGPLSWTSGRMQPIAQRASPAPRSPERVRNDMGVPPIGTINLSAP